MEAEQADRGQLLGAREVAEVVAVVVLAGGAGAAVDERLAVALPAGLAQVEAEAVLGVGDEGDAVAGEAGRHGAVEDVEAEGDAGEQVVDLADPEQVLGRLLGQQRRGHAEHLAHLLLVAAEGAADRDPVDAGRGDRLRPTRGAGPRGRRPGRSRRRPGAPARSSRVPVEAAVEPAVGALGRAGGVVAVGVVGRALVEDQGDVGAERRLHLHRDLGRDEELGAVAVGAEAHPLLLDRDHRALLAARPPAALDLVGDAAVGEREDLEAAGVGDQRPLPAHEPVQPAGVGDPLRARRDEQVVGVAEDQLVAELGDLARTRARAPSPSSPAG